MKMTIEQALINYIENINLFEKQQPQEPAWLTELKNPSPHRKELEKQIASRIKLKEPHLLDLESNILLNMGGYGRCLSTSDYVTWLGRRAFQVGNSQALSELDSWFNREKVDAFYAVVSLGPQIEMPIKVNEKITLFPASQLIDSNLKNDLPLDASGLAVFSNEQRGPLIIKVPTIIAWEDIQMQRVYGDDKPDTFKMRSSHAVMEDALRMVSIINGTHFYIFMRTSGLKDYEPFSGLGNAHCGSKSDVFFADWMSSYNLEFRQGCSAESYQDKFDDVWKSWECCSEELKAKIRLAIDRWSQSQHRESDEDKAIEMRIALEALLVKTKSEPKMSSIRERVKLIFPDNIKPSKLAYDIYNAGSCVVHEGRIPDRFRKKSRSKMEVQDLQKAIQREFPQMAKFVIKNGVPALPDKQSWSEKITRLIKRIIQK